jgi:predicted nucleic acid-binding Zn ribbon protein
VPTYEYRCKACGHELEVVQSFTDGNVGIAFKGTGFYKNDSRGKTASVATSTDKSTADKSSSTSTDGPATPKKDAAASTTSASKGDGAKSGSSASSASST